MGVHINYHELNNISLTDKMVRKHREMKGGLT